MMKPAAQIKKFFLITFFLFLSLIGNAYAYNAQHRPFADYSRIRKTEVTDARGNRIREPAPGWEPDNGQYSFAYQFSENIVLRVTDRWYDGKGCAVQVLKDGREVFPESVFSYYPWWSCSSFFTADLNRDDKIDFILKTINVSGCGLACCHTNTAFLLSSGDTWRLTCVQGLSSRVDDFVVLNGRSCFITTSFETVNKCRDGKHHSFWIYNLIRFDKQGARLDNSIDPAFPKTIWYTYKPNHSETGMITAEQKADLLRKAQEQIVWKQNDRLLFKP